MIQWCCSIHMKDTVNNFQIRYALWISFLTVCYKIKVPEYQHLHHSPVTKINTWGKSLVMVVYFRETCKLWHAILQNSLTHIYQWTDQQINSNKSLPHLHRSPLPSQLNLFHTSTVEFSETYCDTHTASASLIFWCTYLCQCPCSWLSHHQ